MEKGEPLLSWIKKLVAVTAASGLIVGCATSARDLPVDYGSSDAEIKMSTRDFDSNSANLTCSEIDDRLKALESEYALQASDISDKRLQNQVAGMLFFPAMDNSTEAKQKIANINRAKDRLHELRSFKKCPSM